MAATDAELFATPSDEIAYAAIRRQTHREVWPVQSRGFKRWLTHRYFLSFCRAPSSDALNRAIATLDAIAAHGNHAPVFLRRAEKDGKLYLDLCDERWRAIDQRERLAHCRKATRFFHPCTRHAGVVRAGERWQH